MSGSKQTINETSSSNSTSNSSSTANSTASNSTTGTPAAQAAMPNLEADFNASRNANAGWWGGFQPQLQNAANAATGWINQRLGAGYDIQNPILQSIVSTQNDLSGRNFQRNVNALRDELMLRGAYNSGGDRVLSQAVSDQQLNDDSRNAGIYADWMNRQDQLMTQAPQVLQAYGGLGQLGSDANAQDWHNYFTTLATAPGSTQTGSTSGTQTETGSGTTSSTQTQRSSPGALQTLMGIGGTVGGIVGALPSGGASLGLSNMFRPATFAGSLGNAVLDQGRAAAPLVSRTTSQIDPFRMSV